MLKKVNNKKNIFIDQILTKIRNSKEIIKFQWDNPVGTKTKHFYLDEVLPKNDVTKIYESFPRNGEGFFDRKTFREKKRTSANLSLYNKILSEITYAIQDPKVVNEISKVCDMEMLEPDPNLYAGGLSMMFPNDYLNPHIDNSHDRERKRYRRLNLLYYVSPDWKLEYGGNFELWDTKITKPHTILSKQNRLIVMETNKNSWHSVSKVNIDRPRCCVSNYYFSKQSNDQSEYFHVTSFTGRPEQHLKKTLGLIDNKIRNFISKTLKIGRGKNHINKNPK